MAGRWLWGLGRELELELGAGWELLRDVVAGVTVLVLLQLELGAGWEVAVVGVGARLGLVIRTGGASAKGVESGSWWAGLASHLLDVKWAGLTSHLFFFVCPLSSSSPFLLIPCSLALAAMGALSCSCCAFSSPPSCSSCPSWP